MSKKYVQAAAGGAAGARIAGNGVLQQTGTLQSLTTARSTAVVAKAKDPHLDAGFKLTSARKVSIGFASNTAPGTPLPGSVVSPPTAAAANSRRADLGQHSASTADDDSWRAVNALQRSTDAGAGGEAESSGSASDSEASRAIRAERAAVSAANAAAGRWRWRRDWCAPRCRAGASGQRQQAQQQQGHGRGQPPPPPPAATRCCLARREQAQQQAR
jgi:hypothetical protein